MGAAAYEGVCGAGAVWCPFCRHCVCLVHSGAGMVGGEHVREVDMLFQGVDETEFGGAWELTKEGFLTSAAGFLVTWIIIYTGLHIQ